MFPAVFLLAKAVAPSLQDEQLMASMVAVNLVLQTGNNINKHVLGATGRGRVQGASLGQLTAS